MKAPPPAKESRLRALSEEYRALAAKLREGGDSGSPIVIEDPDAESAKVLQQIADGLSGRSRGLAGMQLGLAPAGRL